jgi:hypothetical protein
MMLKWRFLPYVLVLALCYLRCNYYSITSLEMSLSLISYQFDDLHVQGQPLECANLNSAAACCLC